MPNYDREVIAIANRIAAEATEPMSAAARLRLILGIGVVLAAASEMWLQHTAGDATARGFAYIGVGIGSLLCLTAVIAIGVKLGNDASGAGR